MKQLRSFIIITALISLASCTSPDLEGFDEQAWKSDPGGCKGVRKEIASTVNDIKEELKGMGQKKIKSVLGSPEQHELSRRNKKYFIYYVEPGPSCENTSDSSPRTLWIGFDALGRANEIIFQQN
ncbi:MAG: hypothetical protein WBB45_03195 [Cyclobacteriaceae bacterium]